MEVTDPFVVEEFSRSIGIPVEEVADESGLVQLQFEQSGLLTLEPAPEMGGVNVTLSKKVEAFSVATQGVALLKMAQPDCSDPYPIKVGLMNENFVVMCVFLEDARFSTQSLFDVLEVLRERMRVIES